MADRDKTYGLLTDDVDTLQKYITKDVKVEITTTLNTAECEAFICRPEPEVGGVEFVECIANGERDVWDLGVRRVLPAALLVVIYRSLNGIWEVNMREAKA